MAQGTHSHGSAELRIALVGERSAVLRSCSRNPLRLLTPRPLGPSVWACTSSFGGGMVAGDQTSLTLTLDPDSRCFLTTQASTKIYRNPAHLPCSHQLEAQLAENSLLILAPDPVQCFAQASYCQTQRFHLASSSSLLLVDWLSSGRSARGERWAFDHYSSKNEIFRSGQRILLDSQLLKPAHPAFNSRFITGHYNCIGTLILLGPRLQPFASHIVAASAREKIHPGADVIFSASPLAEGAILRFAGTSVELTGRAIFRHLQFVPELLQDNPWARKW